MLGLLGGTLVAWMLGATAVMAGMLGATLVIKLAGELLELAGDLCRSFWRWLGG